MRNRIPLYLAVCLLLPLITGCVKSDETPKAEASAAAQSVQKANVLQKQSQQNVNEGNAVLDGK